MYGMRLTSHGLWVLPPESGNLPGRVCARGDIRPAHPLIQAAPQADVNWDLGAGLFLAAENRLEALWWEEGFN
jgi:hypothetical protein